MTNLNRPMTATISEFELNESYETKQQQTSCNFCHVDYNLQDVIGSLDKIQVILEFNFLHLGISDIKIHFP